MELAGVSVWVWTTFLALVLGFLALDLGVFHRQAHEIKMREALVWSAIWVVVALIFNLVVWLAWDVIQPNSSYTGSEAGMAFFAGYLVERALSIDNIFVFLIVFSYFAVPPKYQHRLLFLGIIGALVFRGIFIGVGTTLVAKFMWTMILFGIFLIGTGVKLFYMKNTNMDPGKNPMLKLLSRFLPITPEYHGQKYFIRQSGKLYATPLLAALVVIEFTDIIFAVDSIPAILAITHNPFIVFTSNVFAILGLRALFFAIAGLMGLFHYLHHALAIILVFVGFKMLYGYMQKVHLKDWPHLAIGPSLLFILLIFVVAIVASIVVKKKHPEAIESGKS